MTEFVNLTHASAPKRLCDVGAKVGDMFLTEQGILMRTANQKYDMWWINIDPNSKNFGFTWSSTCSMTIIKDIKRACISFD